MSSKLSLLSIETKNVHNEKSGLGRAGRWSSKLVVAALAATSLNACAGWGDNFKEIMESDAGKQFGQVLGQSAGDSLSNSEIVTGFKEALANGVETAINQLGQTDGFLANRLVRIEPPGSLAKVAKGLESIGQGQAVDNFRLSMNRAAEKAVPEVADIFGSAIRAITFNDVRSLLNGGDTAVTEFFKAKTTTALTARVRPIVEDATAQTGVTREYKDMIKRAGFLASFLGEDATDLDGYVTTKALDGLFLKIAEQEKDIRNNPAARSSEILERVFGR